MTIYAVNGKEPIAAWIPSLDTAGNGTTTLIDLVGDNHGTLTDMDAATDWVADTDSGGVRALDFDGTNDHVVMTYGGDLLSTGVWSITAWVYWVGASGHAYGFGDSTTTSRYCSMLANSGSLQFNIAGPSQGTTIFTAGSLPVGWHQVTLTMSPSGAAVYVNGSSVSLTVTSGVNNQKTWSAGQMNRFAIGALVRSTTAVWSAIRADDFRLFGVALDADDVAALYIRGRGATNVTTPIVAVNSKTPVAAWVPSISRGDWGATRLTDLVGTNNGTLTNMVVGTAWTLLGGLPILEYFGWDGSLADYVSVPNVTDLNPSSVTVSTWVQFSSVPGNEAAIISKGNTNNQYSMIVTVPGKVVARVNVGGLLDATDPTVPTMGQLYHYVMTYNAVSGDLKLYRDGSVVDAVNKAGGGAINTNSNSLFIGTLSTLQNRFSLNGLQDDTRIFGTALDASDIAYLYNSGNGRGRVVEPAPTGVTYHPLSSRSTHPLRFSI